MCAGITLASVPASHSYGLASSARIAASERPSIGTSVWLSALTIAVPGEVFAAVAHARLQQAVHQTLGEHRDDARIAMEGAIADHAAAAVVEVEHRREAEVDAAGAQFAAKHVAGGGAASSARIAPLAGPPAPSCIHISPSTRIGGKWVKPSLRKRCTRPPSWSTQSSSVGPHRLDLGGKLGELAAIPPVAGEEDHAAGERMGEPAAIVGVERQAGDVEDRPVRGPPGHRARGSCSTTTKLAA